MTDLTDLHTIRDHIRWAVSRFNKAGLYYGHGTENAWDEAVALIFNTLHLTHDLYPVTLEARLTTDEREQIVTLIERRIGERIPLPYLTNEAWFANLSFYVDERVLIPRSPLAELIESQFQPWIEPEDIYSILDLCTGSGCIAIACAKAFPAAHVVASDISTDALAVARINVQRHKVEQNVTLYDSDLFQAIPKQKFNIIISNPPYVDAEDMADLPKEYHHEPRMGLSAGEDGLDLVMRILQTATEYLDSNGILIIEVGNSEHALVDRFPGIPFTWLDFQHGGGGVFLLTAEQLSASQSLFIE